MSHSEQVNTVTLSDEVFARLEKNLNSPAEATPALNAFIQNHLPVEKQVEQARLDALSELSALDQELDLFR